MLFAFDDLQRKSEHPFIVGCEQALEGMLLHKIGISSNQITNAIEKLQQLLLILINMWLVYLRGGTYNYWIIFKYTCCVENAHVALGKCLTQNQQVEECTSNTSRSTGQIICIRSISPSSSTIRSSCLKAISCMSFPVGRKPKHKMLENLSIAKHKSKHREYTNNKKRKWVENQITRNCLFDTQTWGVNPLSVARSLFKKPLRTTQIPSAVSRVKTSCLLTMGAEENTRTGCPLKQNNKIVSRFGKRLNQKEKENRNN